MNAFPAQEPAFFLRRLADLMPSILAYWDNDLRCRFANRACGRWFGVDPDVLVGTSLRDLLGPELLALNQPHIQAVLAGTPQTFERLVPGADGIGRQSLVHYLPDIVDGEVFGFVVQVVEITALKTAEVALKESEARFRTLSESSPSGIYFADANGRRSYTNTRWQEIFGLGNEQALGEGWISALHPDDRDRVVTGWREIAATGREFAMEFRVCKGDGQVRLLRTRAKPVRAGRWHRARVRGRAR